MSHRLEHPVDKKYIYIYVYVFKGGKKKKPSHLPLIGLATFAFPIWPTREVTYIIARPEK